MSIFILLISLFTYAPVQEVKSAQPATKFVTHESDRASDACTQSSTVQDPLIREAVENQYTIRRVEFYGNAHTRDSVLRRRIWLQEGDVFTRENLVKSLKSLSKLTKIIYPVKPSDVIIHLDRTGKFVDMTICFKEKRKQYRRQTVAPANVPADKSTRPTTTWHLFAANHTLGV